MPNNFFANQYKKTSEIIHSDSSDSPRIISSDKSDNDDNKDNKNNNTLSDLLHKHISFPIFEKLPKYETAVPNNTDNIENKTVKKFVFKKIEDVIASEEEKQSKQKPHYDSLGVLSKKKLAAMFLICTDEDKAAKIVSEFNIDELIKISEEILSIDYVTKEDLVQVEKNFGPQHVEDITALKGGKEFLRHLLQNAFGIDKGSQIFMQVLEKTDDKSFSFLQDVSTENVLKIISDESSLIISFVLSKLSPKHAGEILTKLPKDKITEIVKYMSAKTEMNSDVLDIIAKKIKEKTKQIISKDADNIKIGGKDKLVDILKHADAEKAEILINNLETDMPDLAQEIKDKIFTFSDITTLKKSDLETALREWQTQDIAFMLKGTSKEMRAVFFTCVSHRRAEEIVEQIKLLGEVKKSDVIEKQQEFVRYLRSLEADGKISLFPDNEEYVN